VLRSKSVLGWTGDCVLMAGGPCMRLLYHLEDRARMRRQATGRSPRGSKLGPYPKLHIVDLNYLPQSTGRCCQ
jgi:hypothetical protein